MRTKAAICEAPNTRLIVRDIDVDAPEEGEVLVEIVASGICHTDLTALNGQNASSVYPLIPGHEAAGRVVDVGAGVRSLTRGDHVIPLYGPECGNCPMCLSGRTNLCWAIKATRDRGVMPNGASRFHDGETVIHHFMGTSTFSRYTIVPEIALSKIRKDAPLNEVCLFGCGVTTGVGAALSAVREGDKVAVFGLGGIGVNAVQGSRLAGASQIIGVDLIDDRRQLATVAGATDFVNASAAEDVVEMIKDLTHGGVDAVLECTGDLVAMRQSIDVARPGWGVVVLLGVEPPGAQLEIYPVEVRYGKTVRGSYFGGIKGRSGLGKLIDMYMDGQISIDGQITHRLRLENINEGFRTMASHESVRSIIEFEDE